MSNATTAMQEIEEWADPRVVTGLHMAYAHYDAADIERALWATMDLFRWLARETTDYHPLALPIPRQRRRACRGTHNHRPVHARPQ